MSNEGFTFSSMSSELAWFFGGHGQPPGENEAGDKRGLGDVQRLLADGPLRMLQSGQAGAPLTRDIVRAITDLFIATVAEDDPLAGLFGALVGSGTLQEEVCKKTVSVFGYGLTELELDINATSIGTPPAQKPYRIWPEFALGLDPDDQQSAEQAPSKSNPLISAFQIFPIDLAYSSRHADDLDVWFNGIPNIELSRCVPYFDFAVISSNKPVGNDGKPQGLSQHLFLSPNDKLTEVDQILAKGSPLEDDPDPSSTFAGMELFTSPQTLVNADEKYFDLGDESDEGGAGIAVLDQLRPFMSLKSFSVNIQPSFGMASFKTAKLSLTLHDRSRLSQISALVRPDIYGTTELSVEYGWSHPDAINSPGTNPIGDFLNHQRIKEKYRIMNSSFNFTDDGQVEISLDLSMKGSTELYTKTTTGGEGYEDAMEAFSALTDTLSDTFKEIRGSGAVLEDVVGKTILKAGSSSSAMKMSEEDLKKIKEWVNSKTTSDDTSYVGKIASTLQQLYGEDNANKNGSLANLDSKAKAQYDKKIDILKNAYDPYAAPFPMPGVEMTKSSITTSYGKVRKAKYCSLGKLLMTFIGKPLRSSGNFDEIQFVFYAFNRKAGYVRHHNTSQFPIKISTFEKLYTEKFEPTYDTSLASFISFVNKEFIQNIFNSEVYNLTNIYEPERDDDGKETGKLIIASEYAESPKALTDAKTSQLKGAYPEGYPVEFVKPQLEMAFECLPGAVPSKDNDDVFVIDQNKTILRIYIHDKAASANDPQITVLNSLSKQNFQVIAQNSGVETQDSTVTEPFGNQAYVASHASKMVKIHAQLGDLLTTPSNVEITGLAHNGKSITTKVKDYTTVNATAGRLKKFLKTTVPSCTIGSTGSPVLSANLSSMNDAALASIRLSAATKQGKGSISGDADDGFPTFVQPVALTTEMLGMPLLAYGTEMFFDFNTNTNVDNFYTLTGVSHTIDPGNFKTNATWTYVDGFEKFRSLNVDVQRQMVLAAILKSEGGSPDDQDHVDKAESVLGTLVDDGAIIKVNVIPEATSQD